MARFIRKMLDNMFMKIRIGRKFTETFICTKRVGRVFPTSLMLFYTLLKDILDNSSTIQVEGLPDAIKCLMFADGIVILVGNQDDLSSNLS